MTPATVEPQRPASLSPVPGGEGTRAAPIAMVLALPAVAIFLSPALAAALQFDRAAIASGQVWRVVTCHWAHWSLDHLLWDVAAFAVLAFACAARGVRRLAWTVGASALLIPAAVWVALPWMETYRGLSGPASALLALLLVDVMREARGRARWLCGAVLVGFAAKIGFEAVTGSAVFVDSAGAAFVPVPIAHAIGAAVGAAVALLQYRPVDKPRAQGGTSGAPDPGVRGSRERDPGLRRATPAACGGS